MNRPKATLNSHSLDATHISRIIKLTPMVSVRLFDCMDGWYAAMAIQQKSDKMMIMTPATKLGVVRLDAAERRVWSKYLPSRIGEYESKLNHIDDEAADPRCQPTKAETKKFYKALIRVINKYMEKEKS